MKTFLDILKEIGMFNKTNAEVHSLKLLSMKYICYTYILFFCLFQMTVSLIAYIELSFTGITVVQTLPIPSLLHIVRQLKV